MLDFRLAPHGKVIRMTMDAILRFDKVTKIYAQPGVPDFCALRDVTFEVPAGDRIAITGRSGSGKSTFLHLAAGIDRPTSGEVTVAGRALSSLSDRELTLHRRRHVGLVFQFFYLLPHMTVLENVLLPSMIASDPMGPSRRRALDLLDKVGLADRAGQGSHRLSGGEMQRVAICRALMRRASLLLADEPTGNLDDETSQTVMSLLLRLSAEEKTSLIYVTHSDELAAMGDAAWRLHSGVLEPS